MASTQTTTATRPGNVFPAKPTTTTSSPPVTPAQQRIRPYKDFLTPALHRRFTRAALLTFAVCYITSILISPPSLLWIWNPVSFTGIRALLLSLQCLTIFIIRVSNMYVGRTTTTSTARSIGKVLTSWRTAHTLGWYVCSAWIFGEVYLWSQGTGANLEWVDRGRRFEENVWEWPVLNENPVFLRTMWICLAIIQAGLHLTRGYDSLALSKKELSPARGVSSKLPEQIQELMKGLPKVLVHTLQLVINGLALMSSLYWLLIRNTIWPYFSTVARLFHSGLPSDTRPTGCKHGWLLAFQTIYSSFLMAFLWELASTIFTVYVSQPPLRREEPLTAEVKDGRGNVLSRSRDPNGSLLNGLKSRKEVTKGFAFWELCIICEKFETRRKTIYTEVDRKEGSTWTQISQSCLDEIASIQRRIQVAQAPPPAASTLVNDGGPAQQQQLGLPRIADRSVVQDGDVFQRPIQADFAHRMGDMAKSIGQSPTSAQVVGARARKAIEWGADRVLTKSEQERLTPQGLTKEANGTIVQLLQSPLGEPFRQTFPRRVEAVVFGAPHSSRTNVIHASQALSVLCVNSLKEDDYGQVARSIPNILRTYTTTINAVTAFVASLAPHWTDVEFRNANRRVAEVDETVTVLKAGLEGILLAFGEYADAVGVTKKELREARESLGMGMEVRKK